MAMIDWTFLLIFHQAHRIRKVPSIAIYQKVERTFCAHVVQNLKNCQQHEIIKILLGWSQPT